MSKTLTISDSNRCVKCSKVNAIRWPIMRVTPTTGRGLRYSFSCECNGSIYNFNSEHDLVAEWNKLNPNQGEER